MEVHLKIIGVSLIALSAIHIIFPSYFKWDNELSTLSIMNRQMMYVHSFFIAFTILMMGILCITSSSELINTVLGRRISLGLGIFWVIRLYFQFFVYSKKVWKGKTFETTVHVLFSIFWMYISTVFLFICLK